MGHGKKRRRTIWLAVGLVAHAFWPPGTTTLCRSFQIAQAVRLEGGEERCRPCEVAVAQQW